MKVPILTRLYFSLTAIFICAVSNSQSLYPISLERKVNNAELIVEGTVIDQQSFWNPSRTLIFTKNTVELYKVLKGSPGSDVIEIVTFGGAIDNQSMSASDLLELEKGNTGVFFCERSKTDLRSPSTGNKMYDVYSGLQGFLKYDFQMETANAPFARNQDIKNVVFPQIQRLAGQTIQVKKELPKKPSSQNRLFAPGSITFSPSIVNAGALLDPATNILTISGTDFGNPAGAAAVFFDDANDGSGGNFTGLAFNSPLIISWSNTQIQVRVPSRAGTGLIAVQDEFGDFDFSTDELTINYALINSSFSSGTIIKEVNQMNTNGSGGYSVVYSTSTANSGVDFNSVPDAKAAFQRALNTWNEVAGWNVIEGGNTTSQAVANDGVNVVMFDNTAKGVPVLPDGVLGTCYFFSSMCLPGTNGAQLTGFDIVLRNAGVSLGSADFVAGPCPPASSDFGALDLETVILHELGHAIGLAHVNFNYEGTVLPQINPGLLMNYALVNGVKRTSPDNSALTGANYLITPQGNIYGSCGLFANEMTPIAITIDAKDECPTFPVTALASNTTVAFDLEHTTSNLASDPQFTSFNCSGTGTSLTNTAFYPFRTGGGAGGTLTLTITDYATIPAAQASCAPFGSYATAGVELALYQVNSCPGGQAFPAPVACRVFNGNGALTSIAGLTANTNYLLVVDGRENTKATFNLVFTGTVLPVELVSFTGEPKNFTSLLKWETSSENNSSHFEIETSKDGVNYYQIGNIAAQGNSSSSHYYTFTDHVPVIGNNYYRLKQVDLDGNYKYSRTVTVNFNEVQRSITIYPNPADDYINIDLSKPSEKLSIAIHSVDGKLLKSEISGPVQRSKKISVNGLSSGTYIISINAGEETQFLKFIKK